MNQVRGESGGGGWRNLLVVQCISGPSLLSWDYMSLYSLKILTSCILIEYDCAVPIRTKNKNKNNVFIVVVVTTYFLRSTDVLRIGKCLFLVNLTVLGSWNFNGRNKYTVWSCDYGFQWNTFQLLENDNVSI